MTYIYFACHYVGNQASAVLAHELDLALGLADRIVYRSCLLTHVSNNIVLLIQRGHDTRQIFEVIHRRFWRKPDPNP